MKTIFRSHDRLRVVLSRLILLGGGLLLICVGLYLAAEQSLPRTFFGAFLAISGGQIVLWALGIRLEILGNATGQYSAHGLVRGTEEGVADEETLQLLEGRMLAMSGYVLAEAAMATDNLLESADREKLRKAVDLCRRGYEILRDIGGPAEAMALNNLIFYMCVLDDRMRSGFILERARFLLSAGVEHNATHLVLTACRAILQFGDDQREIERAWEILNGLEGSETVTVEELKEARLYLAHYHPDRRPTQILKRTPNGAA